jgi:preprotein translocase subunit YajC
LIFAVFYFILIRPAQKQQKQKEAMLAALKKGDRVVTSGGIYGTISGVEDQSVQLRIAENVKIRVARSAIGGLVEGEGGRAKE